VLPQPDNLVSALLLLFVGFIQLLVVGGLIVLAYAGLGRALGHGVDAWRAGIRRRRSAELVADSESDENELHGSVQM
jgi:hypothetical protein